MRKISFLPFFIFFLLVSCSSTTEIAHQHDEPPYTVMIYMNGSDLESEFGAATDDLAEMLDSGLDSRNANVLILTGGANRWQSSIPETECVIWQLADGNLNELTSLGKVNMGNPDTLRDFLQFCLSRFPAQKYGLIMWDHGGGSIAGFGHDEKFGDAALSLLDMKKAFSEAGLAEKKLEFLGFDACLMATVEMAVLASDFARVLIAAEDLEPGEGWDYGFLAALNENPTICGFALGEIIVDSFIEFFEKMGLADEEILTLSVTDLSKAADVMEAMGRLMSRVSEDVTFRETALRRALTKTFGECSPRDNYADMVDIGDMALRLAEFAPREAADVIRALKAAVTYNRHNSDVEIYGLSTFYIYGGKSMGVESLRTYAALGMNADFTRFLHNFFSNLLQKRGENIDTERVLWQEVGDGIFRMAGLSSGENGEADLWPVFVGENVALFPISETANARRYAIPAEVNGREAEIVVIFTPENPGKILGARYTAANAFQKGYDELRPGDEIALLHLEYNFTTQEESWAKSAPFTIEAVPRLTFAPAPDGAKHGFRHTDLCGDFVYTVPF